MAVTRRRLKPAARLHIGCEREGQVEPARGEICVEVTKNGCKKSWHGESQEFEVRSPQLGGAGGNRRSSRSPTRGMGRRLGLPGQWSSRRSSRLRSWKVTRRDREVPRS